MVPTEGGVQWRVEAPWMNGSNNGSRGCEHSGFNAAACLQCVTNGTANTVQDAACGSGENCARQAITDQHRNGSCHQGPMEERSRLFAGVAPADRARICASARVKRFERGELLYMEGDSVRQVLLLTSGCVKITQLGPNGTESILRVGVPGDVLDEVSLFSSEPHGTTAEAFRMCQTLVWDPTAFKALVERFPVLYQNMVGVLGAHLVELEQRFREVATEKVGSRVARQLIRLMEKMGRQVNGAVEVALSRQELAQMTGTTLFTVSRLLSAWEARGMVLPRRESVTIFDSRSLRSVSD